MKVIELDGRTGEGGGQLIRVAIALAALTSQPVKIINVRGNRQGGGLKSQHVTSIAWLAEVTGAEVEGLSVGSQTLSFVPRLSATEVGGRKFCIAAESAAASSLLVLQGILPFVLFASNAANEPIELELSGGSNVMWSPSYEYFDQVLMPTLEERFAVKIERQLIQRGWSLGPQSRGTISLRVHPVQKGQKLEYTASPTHSFPQSYEVVAVDVSILIPIISHSKMQQYLVDYIGELFPGATVDFKIMEDSSSDARWSMLLVAQSAGGIRWAKDVLCSMNKKVRSRDIFSQKVAKQLCKDLYEEVMLGGQVDQHLQDQVVVFQALCDSISSFPRGDHPAESSTVSEGKMRMERTHEPFGNGSMHTQTARWVVSELLPKAEFYNKGDLVQGVGFNIL